MSAVAICHLREQLDQAGFPNAKVIASSGFGPAKCKLMASVKAPIDVIGTGSYLPERWGKTHATADIVACDGIPRVKIGREFLLRERPKAAEWGPPRRLSMPTVVRTLVEKAVAPCNRTGPAPMSG